jgi:hypothetical protein
VGYRLSEEHAGGGEFVLRDSGGAGPYVTESFASVRKSVNDVLVYDHDPTPDLGEGWYFVRCQEGGCYLDFDSNSLHRDGGKVQAWAPSGWANQMFRFDSVDDFAVAVRTKSDPTRVLTAEGDTLRGWAFTGTASQRWRVVSVGSGFYECHRSEPVGEAARVVAFARSTLRRNVGTVELQAPQGSPHQRFCLERAP